MLSIAKIKVKAAHFLMKARNRLFILTPCIKRVLAWSVYEDKERLQQKVIDVWLQSAQDDLQTVYGLLNELHTKAHFEIEVPQSTVDQAVRIVVRYETVKRPYTPLNARLALRLGLQASTFRRRFLRFLTSIAIAMITNIILEWLFRFPMDWFPIVIFSVLWFIIASHLAGYKLISIIKATTADQTTSEHLFYANLSQLHQRTNVLLQSKHLKKVPQIISALNEISYQRLQRESIHEPITKATIRESKPEQEPPSTSNNYYPMKQAWERFFNEVFRLKEGSYSAPLHRDLGSTEIFVWDIPAIAFSRWEENLTRVEAYLKKPMFFIHQDYDGIGTVGIEIAKQPLPKEIHFSDAIDLRTAVQKPERVIVGMNSKNTVAWNFRKIPHGIVAGTTGAGKSTVLYAIILQLQRQSHLPLFIDLKGGVSFGFVEDVGYPIAETKEAALEMIKSAAQEVERRERLLKEWGVSPDIVVFNEMTGSNLPEIFVIFDEFAQFTEKWPGLDEGMTCIKTIAAKGRSNGVHLLIATQRPSQESLGSTDFRSNIGLRCIGRMDSVASSQIALGNNAAFERLPSTDYAGLFVVRGTDAPMDSLIKVPFINDMDFRRLFLEFRNPHEGYKLGFGKRMTEPTQQMEPRDFNDIF
ncbi:FtsK/SpoIIIE family protein [Paenibacillus sp. 1_12]|uniref:FtsK/SpoIIIE domain-containing protein n=1 Tax=Paenibacillus sp. 1_12 TaxID=1566278 RepID=UPI0008DF08FC|nr:FtsK/SpoIIIE domain-containing protein [Paenibacillus sp. 1_12]SFM12281.1 FtsK/SpoIIIE family protein [Paenibacillus sp. 1_12]